MSAELKKNSKIRSTKKVVIAQNAGTKKKEKSEPRLSAVAPLRQGQQIGAASKNCLPGKYPA
jgi:hypothetical protein